MTDDAIKPIGNKDAVEDLRKIVKRKLEDFTVKMFGSQQPTPAPTPPFPTGRSPPQPASTGNIMKVQDIGYDYMHDLFEMYPNVRLHCALVCKMLELVCDIFLHPTLWGHLKARQAEFFESYPAGGVTQTTPTMQVDEEMKSGNNLATKFDFYCVEVKAKVICMYFKFFQRDERMV